jgi:NitT/TauT family transport system permease protein
MSGLADTGRAKAPGFLDARSGVLAVQMVIVIAFLSFWQLGAGRLFPDFWTSDPASIFGVLAGWAEDGSLWRHLATTLQTMALGYVIGAACGIALGLFLGLFPPAELIIGPYLTALYGLPKIALAPLFVILLGIGIASKVALVACVVVFLVLYTTLDGVRDVDRDYILFMRLMGATWLETLTKVVLPATLPWMYTGLRLAVTYAFTTTVVGEVLSSNRGLGFLITSSAAHFDSAGVFAAVLVLVILTSLLTQLLTHLERWSARGPLI